MLHCMCMMLCVCLNLSIFLICEVWYFILKFGNVIFPCLSKVGMACMSEAGEKGIMGEQRGRYKVSPELAV